jgi:hypothetical protein
MKNKQTKVKVRMEETHQDIVRELTRPLNCTGATVTGWASAATFLRRCQVHDRKQFTGQWVNYPSGRLGWITDTGRTLGVGYTPPLGDLIGEEIMIPIHMPFWGSGRDLKALAEKYIRRVNRQLRKAAR